MKLVSVNKSNKSSVDKFGKKQWKIFNGKNHYLWDEKKYSYIIKENNFIKGFISFRINGGVAYLSQLIVKDSEKRIGIGKILITRFEEFAKKQKCHVAYLETSEKHKEALIFYEKLGYKIKAQLKNNKFHFTWYFLSKNLK